MSTGRDYFYFNVAVGALISQVFVAISRHEGRKIPLALDHVGHLQVDLASGLVDSNDRHLDSLPFDFFGVWLGCFHFPVVNREEFINLPIQTGPALRKA